MVVKLPGNKTDNRRSEPTVDALELVEKIILFALLYSYLALGLTEKKGPHEGLFY